MKFKLDAHPAQQMSDQAAPLTRDTIVAQLRNADDRLVVELIATGANVKDLSTALAWLSDNDAAVRAGVDPPIGRAGEIMAILRKAEEATEAPSALDEP
jgi:hypothetical protein